MSFINWRKSMKKILILLAFSLLADVTVAQDEA